MTQGEIADIMLEEGFFNEAIKEAEEALAEIKHFNALSVKFLCILMRAYFYKGENIDA